MIYGLSESKSDDAASREKIGISDLCGSSVRGIEVITSDDPYDRICLIAEDQ